MRRFSIIWLLHWFFTVGGWYLVSALAQGVADGSGVAPPALVVMNAFIQLLAFPLVISAVWIWPMQIGGFSLGSFALFTLIAAVNSALVVAALFRLLRRYPSEAP